MSYKAIDIANKLLKYAADSPEGEYMSSMKLQKMLYDFHRNGVWRYL